MYSVIIPTYGIKGISMVDNLLDSISRFDNPSLDEIIISDDGSSTYTINALCALIYKYENVFKKIIPVFNPSYHSFSKTVNCGMKISSFNNAVLILNNDMLALTGFESFPDFMKQNGKVGIIGAKLIYPNLTIQHAGMVRMSLLNRFRHIYKHRNYNHPPANIQKKYISVTGACQYINRELINKIGYFDERYKLSYEDVDYCINAQSNGYEVWYTPYVTMTHYESATRTDPYHEQNRALFWSKWGSSYEQIRSSGDIPDDDLDIKVAKASGMTTLLYLILKK